MTFEQLGSLGEFIGALAVLGSLIYVAREIRENSRSTRLAAMQSTMLAAQNVMALPAQDLGLALLGERFRKEVLSRIEVSKPPDESQG